MKKNGLISVWALDGISSVSTLKNTLLKSPCLCLRALQCCNWLLWKYTGERKQPHKNKHERLKCQQRPISKSAEIFFKPQWRLLLSFHHFYLLDWEKSLWASCVFSASQTKPRRNPVHSTEHERTVIVSVWPHPVCLSANPTALIHKLVHKHSIPPEEI